MSNYLSHLVNRSLDRANQVQPRLPSLFEPLPEAVGLRAAFAGDNDLTMTAASETAEGETFRSRAPNIQDVEASVPPKAFFPAIARPERRPQLTDQELSVRSQSPILPTPPSENFSVSPSQTPRAEGQPELLPEMLTLSPHILTPFSPTPPPTVIEQWNEVVIPVSPSVPSSVRQPEITTERLEQNHPTLTPVIKPTPVPPSASTSVQPLPTIRPATVVSSATELIASQMRSLERQAIASPQPDLPTPTIHVTIGRIEVRATFPSTPTQPKARPAPAVMNLDDYLRQRGGGK